MSNENEEMKDSFFPKENDENSSNENNIYGNNNNEENINENINELFPKILEKAVEILNDTGNKIQFFKKTLHQIDESIKNNNKENEKSNDIIDLKNLIDKKAISELLKKEKEIFCNLAFLNKIFPTYTNIPEKIFNTRTFLEICFMDLIITHSSILDMDISGQLLLMQYKRYENKNIDFLISKKKIYNTFIKVINYYVR